METDFRLDFIMEVVSFDEEGSTCQIKLKPNPRRYEEKTIDGKRYLLDRFDNLLFEEQMFFREMARQMEGQPIYLQKQELGSIDLYIESRCKEIESYLQRGIQSDYEFVDKSEEFLRSVPVETLEFAIMSVDISGSTTLSSKLDLLHYSKVVSAFIRELSLIVPQFKGFVLKYTGDGVLAYFPAPSLIRMNDLCIDCALCIRKLVYVGINPILERIKLPRIGLRIGIDSGEAAILELGSPASKLQKDIIGSVINITTKVQSVSGEGNVAVGQSACRRLHTMYREVLEEITLRQDWPYKNAHGETYRVFRVKPGAKIEYP